jgi:VanZ family protein
MPGFGRKAMRRRPRRKANPRGRMAGFESWGHSFWKFRGRRDFRPAVFRCIVHSEQMKIPNVALRFIAWACVIGLAVASWTPGQDIVRTGFNTQLEHMVAYLIAGIAVLVAYPRTPALSIAVFLSVYAGALELGQMYIPGRHAALLDWLASSSGALCACMTMFVYRRHRHQK